MTKILRTIADRSLTVAARSGAGAGPRGWGTRLALALLSMQALFGAIGCTLSNPAEDL